MPLDSLNPPIFELRESGTDATVFTGTSTYRGEDLRLSGEYVFDCDFSSFTTVGDYYLYVPTVGRSYAFTIDTDIYDSVYYHSARAYYYQRHSDCLLYTSPSPRDRQKSRMPSSA